MWHRQHRAHVKHERCCERARLRRRTDSSGEYCWSHEYWRQAWKRCCCTSNKTKTEIPTACYSRYGYDWMRAMPRGILAYQVAATAGNHVLAEYVEELVRGIGANLLDVHERDENAEARSWEFLDPASPPWV